MRYLTLREVLELCLRMMEQCGSTLIGIRDRTALESAIAQPQMTFGGKELYPTLTDKAAALAFSLVKNHPFLDGNKRTGHASMELFLLLNGLELEASVDEQERAIVQLAAGELTREEFNEWVRLHSVSTIQKFTQP
jgi:death-on-curing protein